MGKNWDRYAEKMDRILAMRDVDQAESPTIGLPPVDEIALRHELTTPDIPKLLTRNMRTANLSNNEFLVVRKVSAFYTWLTSLARTHNLTRDTNIIQLENEIIYDLNVILNTSVAKKGWLVDNILNPKKRFGLLPSPDENRGFLHRNKKDD